MKKIFILVISLLFLTVHAETLKGGVVSEYIPSGFFGSWGVISKLNSSNNPRLFNYESRDIWTLSGYNNILVLENLQSGARSEIQIKDKNKDGKTLTFERIKSVNNKDGKTVYKEIVKFKLMDDNFSGSDDFIVEKYDLNNKLIEKNCANYTIAGVRISGSSPD